MVAAQLTFSAPRADRPPPAHGALWVRGKIGRPGPCCPSDKISWRARGCPKPWPPDSVFRPWCGW